MVFKNAESIERYGDGDFVSDKGTHITDGQIHRL